MPHPENIEKIAADVAIEVQDRVSQDVGDWPGMDVIASMPGGFVISDRTTGFQFDVKVTPRAIVGVEAPNGPGHRPWAI